VTLAVALESLPAASAIRAAADVIEVEEGHGFCASVYLEPGAVAVARLDRSLAGASHEGEVLRQAMWATTGMHGNGLFFWHLSGGIVVHRCLGVTVVT
jgi:hypothetical protein